MNITTQTWLFVAVAGGIGTLARYALGSSLVRSNGGVFPLETLTINVVGSLLIGVLSGAVDRGALLPICERHSCSGCSEASQHSRHSRWRRSDSQTVASGEMRCST